MSRSGERAPPRREWLSPSGSHVVRSIRWSPAEWDTIRHRAARDNIRPATYVRRTTLGAPPLPPRAPRARRTRFSTPRTVSPKIRFHPDELARIRHLAETLAMPTSTFVRDAAVGYRISSRADTETIRHLARIGNLLNQLTRLAHQTQRVDPARRLAAVLAQLREVLASLT